MFQTPEQVANTNAIFNHFGSIAASAQDQRDQQEATADDQEASQTAAMQRTQYDQTQENQRSTSNQQNQARLALMSEANKNQQEGNKQGIDAAKTDVTTNQKYLDPGTWDTGTIEAAKANIAYSQAHIGGFIQSLTAGQVPSAYTPPPTVVPTYSDDYINRQKLKDATAGAELEYKNAQIREANKRTSVLGAPKPGNAPKSTVHVGDATLPYNTPDDYANVLGAISTASAAQADTQADAQVMASSAFTIDPANPASNPNYNIDPTTHKVQTGPGGPILSAAGLQLKTQLKNAAKSTILYSNVAQHFQKVFQSAATGDYGDGAETWAKKLKEAKIIPSLTSIPPARIPYVVGILKRWYSADPSANQGAFDLYQKLSGPVLENEAAIPHWTKTTRGKDGPVTSEAENPPEAWQYDYQGAQ